MLRCSTLGCTSFTRPNARRAFYSFACSSPVQGAFANGSRIIRTSTSYQASPTLTSPPVSLATYPRLHPTPICNMSTQAASTLFPSFETNNFYAGNLLNRASWLRSSPDFLNKALRSSNTPARIVLLQHGNPLVHGSGNLEGRLATLDWSRVSSALGRSATQDIFGAQANGLYRPTSVDPAKSDEAHEETISEKDWKRATESFVPPGLAMVFLGVLQEEAAGTQQETTNEVRGVPYFAISLTHRIPKGSKSSDQDVADAQGLEKLQEELLKEGTSASILVLAHSLAMPRQLSSQPMDARTVTGYDFVDTRALAQAGSWPAGEAALVAEAKSLVDWNERMNVSN